MSRVSSDSASANGTALSIECPREGMIENSTHGISALWSVAATDNVSAPIELYLNQTAHNGEMTSEESGPIEMGQGEYTFSSPAVTLSTYHLLIVAENQTLSVGHFKVSVNWTLNEQTSSSAGFTSSVSSAIIRASSKVDGAATDLDTSMSSIDSAPRAEHQTRSAESGKESTKVTTDPQGQDGNDHDSEVEIGVAIGLFVLFAFIAGGIMCYFRSDKRLGSLNPPPPGVELGRMSRAARPVRTNVAQLEAQTLSEVH